jgi:hypothetical protein
MDERADSVGYSRIFGGDSMSTKVPAASSSYFQIPRFSKGDLEEVMLSFRPQDIRDLSGSNWNEDVPFFHFPEPPGSGETST